jgi:hypothetical protein
MSTGPLGEVANDSNFFVAFTSTQGYGKAATKLIESLPVQWKGKYIQINQNTASKNYVVAEDGHITVNLIRNMHQFGNWIGVQYLIDNNVIPRDAWFLFLHDTCVCGQDTAMLVEQNIEELNETNENLSWLTQDALGYLCLIRNIGITYGAAIYKNKFNKKITNWKNAPEINPLNFKIRQHFPDNVAKEGHMEKIYSDKIIRKALYIESYDLTKYQYVSTNVVQSNPNHA